MRFASSDWPISLSASLRARSQEARNGKFASRAYSIDDDSRYRVVPPGYPRTKTKSFSFRPPIFMVKNFFGLYGTLFGEYAAAVPSGATYARRKVKSPVCRVHSKLSGSPPKMPMFRG